MNFVDYHMGGVLGARRSRHGWFCEGVYALAVPAGFFVGVAESIIGFLSAS